ncbi:HNH endonuclease [Geomonas edaphica]|uniref:HNH endonuclease n=1 Tax=Geomonas edaphica TaxID=2570226 RepID=UPI0010A7645E|nr:HNH endonuclease [Geomonas edaphica]
MSKKYKNKICVYCGNESSKTADHVFAREFFLLTKRDNLPKVPSCLCCNGQKSQLEHYLSSLLPFGGQHQDAKTNLTEMVPKRLSRNQRLHEELNRNKSYSLLRDSSAQVVTSMVLPFDGEKLLTLFEYITKGLLWHHWQTLLSDEYFVQTLALTRAGEDFFQNKFLNLYSPNRVSVTLGGDTFRYIGAQGVDDPRISAWVFTVYNGVRLSESGTDLGETSTKIGALTGSKRLLEKLPLA